MPRAYLFLVYASTRVRRRCDSVVVAALDAHLPALLVKLAAVGPDYLTGGIQGPEGRIVCTLVPTCGIAYHLFARRRKWRYFPSGVETSVPGCGVNSNIDAGTGSRV